MALLSVLILTSLSIGVLQALTRTDCGAYSRKPEYTDISVVCGTSTMDLTILICPAVYTGYNETLLILNQIVDNPDCKGRLDMSVTPPVLRFSFPIRLGNACGSTFLTTSSPGVGIFSDFSNIQTVNVSGVVRSFDPTVGTVTYNAELKYFYSCAYPLEYLINNTQVDVAASSIALKEINGSFISTLSMALYKDENYTTPLIIPYQGVELRTNINVQVLAVNLTSQYNVLLDRCYASISPRPSNSTIFNLFVSCSVNQQTIIVENGVSQKARFNFPAFRFIEQQNETVSTYYLHCITRLCEPSTCSTFKQCNRRRRSVEAIINDGVTEQTILTVPIKTRAESPLTSPNAALSGDQKYEMGTSVGLVIAVAVLIVVAVAAILMAATFYRKLSRLG
ncbi:zona pellucida-like domain-containing protein 1 [Hypomesus transpacificus]|uniref:zona pellucida-like domain-containing protein 1 n=1 Tax=Hypomesus transpacificus TaxID=137520 RepID=UPI001F074FEB|nr:zona pellucida-like domain-containing protein 1 [Hypomesus transpacificus]